MEFITVGQNVKIKRTDGRVHSAVVSKMNENGKSLTVEWYERGETKGKEVELEAILSLNPEIFQMPTDILAAEPPAAAPEPVKKLPTSAAVANLSRNTTQGAIGSRTNRVTVSSSYALPTIEHGASVTEMAPPPTTGIMRSRTTSNTARLSSAAANATGLINTSVNANALTLATTASSTAVNSGVSAVSGAAGGARRSYVVKEVERLKENREKRRARQAEMKEEKHALMAQDPGNPNWETAQMIREYQNTLEFNPLVDGQVYEDHQITVCVRKRPLSRKEVQRKEIDVISVPRKDTLIVHEPRTKVDLTKFLENHKFRFDYAFDDRCDNAMVYKYTAKPLVQTIFDGGMATCFAYGQTGSGKTHTMGGEFNGKVQDCKNGIYAMAAKDVFTFLKSAKYRSLNLVVSSSFFEIYSGKVFDLLSNKQKLRVLEDGKQQVQVVGLTEKVVDSVEEVLKLIQHGNNARTSGQTSANSNSSRSHAVFQIVLRPPGSMKIHGKFSFIDLAGNERGADTSSANRQTRMEGAEINKSLLALKECIRALGRASAHLPFRVSKLTQVLRDSFIGEKSKTCMIAMISPGLSSCEHTLNTLRYADRVKELVVKDLADMDRDGREQIREIDELEEHEDDEEVEDDNSERQQQRGGRPYGNSTSSSAGNNHMQQNNHNNLNNNNNNNNNKNGQMSANDLAILRSLSEHDMSDELLVQHAAISDLQQAEEMVVDQHRGINEFLAHFVPESMNLYDLTNYVDYDQDAYCKQGEALFTQLAELAIGCRDMMADFRAKLAKEEMLSATVKSPGKR